MAHNDQNSPYWHKRQFFIKKSILTVLILVGKPPPYQLVWFNPLYAIKMGLLEDLCIV
jgi:hypothetical protein